VTFAAKPECIARVKKLQWHTKFGEIEVLGPQYRHENKRVRPFIVGAKVKSARLFAAFAARDRGFRSGRSLCSGSLEIAGALRFQDGESTVQRITLGHAEAIFESSPSLSKSSC